jgi:RNA polymerase sigma factor (sigma-70 family)
MLAGSRTDAEDALQDVFLRAYSALRSDDRPVTLRAWLYRVAHNRCVDELRRPLPAPADVFDLTRTPLQDPLAEAERREDLRRLVADVRRLPEQQRSALLMRELEGLSYHELADALGVTLPAVKSLLVRARVGLVEAGEARDTACGVIRGDILDAHDRGVRCDGRTRRHLHDCGGCRDYRDALRAARRGLAAFNPGCGPLATLAKLAGLGGAGSGAAAGAGSAAGGGALAGGGAVAGGVAAGTATKVAAVICCAAVVGGAGVGKELRERHRDAAPARAAATAGAPAGAALAAPDRLVALAGADALAPRSAARRERARAAARRRAAATADERSEVVVEVPPPASAPDPEVAARISAERATGGAAAPDEEDLPGEPAPEDGSAPSGAAPAPGVDAAEATAVPAGSAVSTVTAAGTNAPGSGAGTSAGAHTAVAAGAPAAAGG